MPHDAGARRASTDHANIMGAVAEDAGAYKAAAIDAGSCRAMSLDGGPLYAIGLDTDTIATLSHYTMSRIVADAEDPSSRGRRGIEGFEVELLFFVYTLSSENPNITNASADFWIALGNPCHPTTTRLRFNVTPLLCPKYSWSSGSGDTGSFITNTFNTRARCRLRKNCATPMRHFPPKRRHKGVIRLFRNRHFVSPS
jgi:hypothetical protein